jgi:NAD(P)-dependent dehydrogenase (short-subunit alcohol dehydrogenase family)
MSKTSIDKSIQSINDDFGTIDILVNNAKVNFGKRFEEVTESEFDNLMDFNLKSMFLTCQSVGRTMLKNKRGRIVNMTSDLAVRGLWNSVVPCASEGAIHQLTSSLALEWGRDGIRVNGIGAGWLSTKEKSDPSEPDLLERYIPSRRKGHPNELTQMLVYLSSDSCGFVNGQTIFIDGGALAHA